jgi:hypothetical protein
MRSIALALALTAAPFLSGCLAAPCDAPTVTIYWELADYLGNQNVSCNSVTTTWVDLYIGPMQPVRVACTNYGTTIDVSNLAPGSYPVTVEGIDADGTTIWSRDQFPVSVGDCGGNATYTARPGEGTLALDYFYPVGGTCSGGYMWYSLFDVVAKQTISAIYGASSTTDKTRYLCGNYPPPPAYQIEIAVPFGTYELDWIQEVVNPTTTAVPVYQACGPISQAVTGVGVTPLTVGMTPWTAACP